jgi:hypothetical protein
MHVRRTTEMMTRGMAVGNSFRVCFRVTCFGNQKSRDFGSLIGRGIVGGSSVSVVSEGVMNFGRGETVAWRGLREGNKRKL